jgi:predicted transcriptional regulator YdeE
MQQKAEPAFKMVGLQVRTSNSRESTSEGLIRKQWQRLFGEGLIAQIPNRTDSAVVALYTDYASDEHGEYTYVVGARVSGCESVPKGMTCRSVPAAKYITLLSARGSTPKIVIDLWQKVWASTPAQLGGVRSFRNDYELYDQSTSGDSNVQVELHLGIR